jgi:hypothetical protein
VVRGEKDAIRLWSGGVFTGVRWALPALVDEARAVLSLADYAAYPGDCGRSETRTAGREDIGGFRWDAENAGKE